jgi:hypothetical protein
MGRWVYNSLSGVELGGSVPLDSKLCKPTEERPDTPSQGARST